MWFASHRATCSNTRQSVGNTAFWRTQLRRLVTPCHRPKNRGGRPLLIDAQVETKSRQSCSGPTMCQRLRPGSRCTLTRVSCLLTRQARRPPYECRKRYKRIQFLHRLFGQEQQNSSGKRQQCDEDDEFTLGHPVHRVRSLSSWVVAGSPDPITRLTEGLSFPQLGSRFLDAFTKNERPAKQEPGDLFNRGHDSAHFL